MNNLHTFYQHLKNIYHFFVAHLWRAYYRFPDRDLRLVAVTGTNGKTTTCYVLASILRAHYGLENVGMLTTVAFWIGGLEEVNMTKMTVLPSRLLYYYLRRMRDAGVQHVVLEVTSHALDQHRLAGMSFAGAALLNIEREHLDYHGTMVAYARAKGLIVRYLEPGAQLIAKRDDMRVRGVVESEARKQLLDGAVRWFTRQEAQLVTTALPGEWNQDNVLAATLLARSVGVSEDAIARGVSAVTQVPGRMEWIDTNRGFRVLIDYAVTPDALDRLYRYVRGVTGGRIFAVLGAAGLRDRGKRSDMARAVEQYAHELVLTREDPWTENEEQIFADLERGLDLAQDGITWRRIVDRRQALRYVLCRAQSGDTVVVTGKGAEMGMGIGESIVPWNEREVILELLTELKGAGSASSTA